MGGEDFIPVALEKSFPGPAVLLLLPMPGSHSPWSWGWLTFTHLDSMEQEQAGGEFAQKENQDVPTIRLGVHVVRVQPADVPNSGLLPQRARDTWSLSIFPSDTTVLSLLCQPSCAPCLGR